MNEQAYKFSFVCSQCGPQIVLIHRARELDVCPRCDGLTIVSQAITPFGEREWLSCEEWELMAQWVDWSFSPGIGNKKGTHRKFRLFAVLCCRSLWRLFMDESFRQAVEVAEAFADGMATEGDRKKAWEKAHTIGWRTGAVGVHWAAINAVGDQPFAIFFPCYVLALNDNESVGGLIAHWLLDIFGNPFRPVALDPSWRTEAVVALAEGIYADRAFDRMPVLADALEDAGCSHHDILSHCRAAGPHVRGCWVVDLVLGKE